MPTKETRPEIVRAPPQGGERFGANELHVTLNFFEELKARVGN